MIFLKGMSADTRIAFAALIISVFSFLMSWYSLHQQKKLNTQNLQAIYFKELFQEYLLKKIPEAALKLNFDSRGRLEVTYREINKVMMEMIKGARYFVFADLDFYSQLQTKAQNLEDELAELSNQTLTDKMDQDQGIVHINTLISEIVEFINKKYCR